MSVSLFINSMELVAKTPGLKYFLAIVAQLFNFLHYRIGLRNASISEMEREFVEDLRLLRKFYVEPSLQVQNPVEPEVAQHSSRESAFSYIARISRLELGHSKPRKRAFKFIESTSNLLKVRTDGRNVVIILADAGMGKTSLLLMLWLKEKISFFPSKYKISLLKIGKNTLAEVKNCDDKKNTILLLDSLDEDSEALANIENRLIEILDAIDGYHMVVISCRTQFFLTRGDNPFDQTGLLRIGGFRCPVMFLSPFDEKSCNKYIHKKFAFQFQKQLMAKKVVKQMGDLRCRPLLLSHLDDFIEARIELINFNEYRIYDSLIDLWLEREERKIRKHLNKEVTSSILKQCCAMLAAEMQIKNVRSITIKDINLHRRSLVNVSHIEDLDIGGRSLLNKNSEGAFVFSHYSLREFLVIFGITKGFLQFSEIIPVTDGMMRFIHLSGHPIHEFFRYLEVRDLLSYMQSMYGQTIDELTFSNSDLSNADLNGLEVNQYTGKNSVLYNSNFNSTNLSNAKFNNLTITDVDFKNANLCFASFDNVHFQRTDFRNVDFSNAIFSNCRFEWCKMDSSVFHNANISNVHFFCCYGLPDLPKNVREFHGVKITNSSLFEN